jgi:hypothetical protein
MDVSPEPEWETDDVLSVDNSELIAAFHVGNRRLAPRVVRHFPVRYRTRSGQCGEGLTMDVSRTGARIVFYCRPRCRTSLLTIEVGSFELVGRTVWEKPVEGKQAVVRGVRFQHVDEAQRAQLDRLLSPHAL